LQAGAADSRGDPAPAAAPVRPAAAPVRPATPPAAAAPSAAAIGTMPARGAVGPGDRPVADDQDVHAWLCRRMEALQQERQSGWQKILNFFVGKRPGEAAP